MCNLQHHNTDFCMYIVGNFLPDGAEASVDIVGDAFTPVSVPSDRSVGHDTAPDLDAAYVDSLRIK